MSAGVPLSTEVDSKRVAYSSSVVDKNAANTKVRLIAQKKSIATSLFHLDLDRLKACCQMGKCLGIIYSRPNPMNAIHPLNETLCRTFLTRVQSCVNRNGLLVRHRHVHVALGAGEDALNSIPRSRSSHGVGASLQVSPRVCPELGLHVAVDLAAAAVEPADIEVADGADAAGLERRYGKVCRGDGAALGGRGDGGGCCTAAAPLGAAVLERDDAGLLETPDLAL